MHEYVLKLKQSWCNKVKRHLKASYTTMQCNDVKKIVARHKIKQDSHGKILNKTLKNAWDKTLKQSTKIKWGIEIRALKWKR
jgi:hypothetical protein